MDVRTASEGAFSFQWLYALAVLTPERGIRADLLLYFSRFRSWQTVLFRLLITCAMLQ
jgi:hypothetical protein